MERVIDLDAAAGEIEQRRPRWAAEGWEVKPITWRDASRPFDRPLLTERAEAVDPDSVGVKLVKAEVAAGDFCLFRGGWADVVTGGLSGEGELIVAAPDIPHLRALARALDEFWDLLVNLDR